MFCLTKLTLLSTTSPTVVRVSKEEIEALLTNDNVPEILVGIITLFDNEGLIDIDTISSNTTAIIVPRESLDHYKIGWGSYYANIIYPNYYIVNLYDYNNILVDSINVDYDTIIETPESLNLENCTFQGWYTDTNYTTEYENFNITLTEDQNLYAKLTTIITVVKGDAEIEKTVTLGNEYEELLTEEFPDKSGYTLKGLNYINNLSNETVTITETTLYNYEDGITISPLYEANIYTINFYINYEDAENITAREISYDNELVLPNPEREGYVLTGWYYNGEKIDNGTIFNNSIFDINSDILLVAEWEESVNLIWLYISSAIILVGASTTLFIVIRKKSHFKKLASSRTPNIEI